MSDVQETAPVAVASPAGVVSAKPAEAPAKLSAIQQVEQEILSFFQQREQAIARLHAVEGAIQAGQHILAKLKAGEATAIAEAKKLIGEAKPEVESALSAVKGEAEKAAAFVEAKAKEVVAAVEAEVGKL
jgi:hypothetical protein